MNLTEFAERILGHASSSETIRLHVADAAAVFLAGVRTEEGRAIARLYRERRDVADRAAAVAAIVRLTECDDIHLASCVTPGAAVIPVALAFAGGSSSDRFNRAVAAGYAAGLSVGTGIGGTKALARGVWPTLLAAPLMAAVTVSCLQGLTSDALAHAMALSLGGASGRLGRPSPLGRWYSFAQAISKGVHAAEAAGQGVRGDIQLFSRAWFVAQAGHEDVLTNFFESPTTSPSIAEVGFKPFPTARQGANAILAFQKLLSKGIDPAQIDSIQVFVPTMNIALLTRPVLDDDRLSKLCNIGFQLACAAFAPELLYDVERKARRAGPLLEFAGRVQILPSRDFDDHWPSRWAARVVVHSGSDCREETLIQSPFDHDAENLPYELREKWRRLLLPHERADLFTETGEKLPETGPLWSQMLRELPGD